MLSYDELRQSLFIFSRHICCAEAERYLLPPQEGTNGFVQYDGGEVLFKAYPNWHIDLGDGGSLIDVQFCPFCGIKLPTQE